MCMCMLQVPLKQVRIRLLASFAGSLKPASLTSNDVALTVHVRLEPR